MIFTCETSQGLRECVLSEKTGHKSSGKIRKWASKGDGEEEKLQRRCFSWNVTSVREGQGDGREITKHANKKQDEKSE